ncbi:hypothetical protein N7G274_003153 [Stereocaulon virgatum]|uniref:BTB domain-containing protein n=1 Tax=Stereocaulon virgatum TaxID=373712 RepID=A0ABR4AH78_9LECA
MPDISPPATLPFSANDLSSLSTWVSLFPDDSFVDLVGLIPPPNLTPFRLSSPNFSRPSIAELSERYPGLKPARLRRARINKPSPHVQAGKTAGKTARPTNSLLLTTPADATAISHTQESTTISSSFTTLDSNAPKLVNPMSGRVAEHVSKKPRINQDSFDIIVVVKVGPLKTEFKMHKGLLCNVALSFKAALDGHFAEAKSAVIELPEEDVIMFKRFQLWTYTNRLLEEGEGEREVAWGTLAGLYIFGEARGIPTLQNTAIDLMIDKQAAENIIPTTLLHRVYQRLPEDSPLRTLMVDWCSSLGGLDTWFLNDDTRDQCPKDFLFDLTVALYLHKKGAKFITADFRDVRERYYITAPASSQPY